jgi:RNA polymerase sigma-70 factor (ECF subfamily)
MQSTPVTLLERLRHADDSAAWAQFVRLYTPLMYAWARGAGLSEADAADLLQDVFTTLLQELPRFEYQPGKSFRAWVRTILLNRWRTLRRRRQPQSVRPEALEQVADDDPALPAEEEELRQLVARALALLEPEFQPATWQAFRQYAVLGRAPAAVGAELGLSVNAVYLAKSHVMRRLREQLAGLID